MSILIRNSKTEKKIRQLAKRKGVTLTDAVDRAIDNELAQLGPPRKKARVRLPRLLPVTSRRSWLFLRDSVTSRKAVEILL